MLQSSNQASRQEIYLWWGLGVSLLAHVALAFLLNHHTPHELPPVFTVDIEPEPVRPTRVAQTAPKQIVSTPQLAPSEIEPREARFLAEKNFVTEQEKIHRGDRPDASSALAREARPPEKSQRPSPKSAPKEEQQNRERPAKLKELALDPSTVRDNFSLSRQQPSPNTNEKSSPLSIPKPSYRAFSRPPGSGAAFLGTSGVPDYIPNLPDGDLTLLNAKANLFAVFVRRVATQVFSQLRLNGWANLSAGDIQAIDDFVIVRATMSPEGKLLRTEIEESSGSRRFDDTVRTAAESGARDQNPPKGAQASDGNIHFIFQSRSWTQMGAAPRNGAPMERRWLLLGTGLE